MWPVIFTMSLAFIQIYATTIDPVCNTSDADPDLCHELTNNKINGDELILQYWDCALTVQNAADYESADKDLEEWKSEQCLAACLGKKTGIIKNNSIHIDTAIDIFSKVLAKDVDEPLIREAVEICERFVRKPVFNSNDEENTCSKLAFYFYTCTMATIGFKSFLPA